MAVSLFSDTDLRLLCGMGPKQFRAVIGGKSVREALIFRRNLQMSLAEYSKRRPAIGKLDEVQGNAIMLCYEIERLARNTFTVTAWRKIKMANPRMNLTERIDRKSKIRTDWEKLLKTYSY